MAVISFMSRWPQEAHLTKIKTLFSKFGGQANEADTDFITFPMFEEKINTPEVRDYFESLRLVAWFKQVLLIFAHVHQLKHELAARKSANHTCSADFSVRIFSKKYNEIILWMCFNDSCCLGVVFPKKN